MKLYQPSHFKAEQDAALALIRAYPFALLASVGGAEPWITHLPLVVDETDGRMRLRGHLARANLHQQELVSGREVTAIFRGPDAYITPAWYEAVEAVPTWNYLVVHVHGVVQRVEEEAAKEHILKALIDTHDPDYRKRWDEEMSADYRSRMLRAIVGLEIEVQRCEAKFKLGQNRSRSDQARMLAGLEQGGAGQRALADWMRKMLVGTLP